MSFNVATNGRFFSSKLAGRVVYGRFFHHTTKGLDEIRVSETRYNFCCYCSALIVCRINAS